MSLRPVSRKSIADEVFQQLTRGIVQGEMAPGQPLPSERELSELLGVSRGAVREALQRLSQAGLIHIRHGGATKVLDYRENGGLELLVHLLLRPDGTIDVAAGRAVIEMRTVLVPDIARRCAERASAEDRAALAEAVAAMAAAGDDLERLAELALQFFEALVRGSNNIAYQLAQNTLRRAYDPIRSVLVNVLEDELRALADYRALAAAVAAADGDAAAAVSARLIEKGTDRLLRMLSALERLSSKTLAP